MIGNPYGQFLQNTQGINYGQQQNANYGNYNQTIPQQTVPQPMSQQQNVVRVNGLEGAKAYTMNANSVVALFDANEEKFYLKISDGANFSTINTYSYTPYEENKVEVNQTQEFVSRAEFEQFKSQLMSMASTMQEKVEEPTTKVTRSSKSTTKAEV